jgi:hypothetical protein
MESYQAHLFGDLAPLGTIGRTLAKVPKPVAECCVQSTTTLATGVSSSAWTARLEFPRDRLIVVLTAADAKLVAHEAAHCFYDFSIDGVDLAGLDLSAVAVARGRHQLALRHDPILQQHELAELRATVVSRAWLLAPWPAEA